MLQYEHFGEIEIKMLKAKAQRQKQMLEKQKEVKKPEGKTK